MSAGTRFTTFHFSQANPIDDPDKGSVPALLRRVADTIEGYGDVQVQDLVLHSEITEDGDRWPSVTVYYDDNNGQ
jgi:hypothetical protein